jgi:hypothetical protein
MTDHETTSSDAAMSRTYWTRCCLALATRRLRRGRGSYGWCLSRRVGQCRRCPRKAGRMSSARKLLDHVERLRARMAPDQWAEFERQVQKDLVSLNVVSEARVASMSSIEKLIAILIWQVPPLADSTRCDTATHRPLMPRQEGAPNRSSSWCIERRSRSTSGGRRKGRCSA